MNNLIQQLKDNEKAFCKMSNEMQKKANEIGWSEFLRLAICFPNTWDKNQTLFSPGHTFQLRPDYEDEPKIEERLIMRAEAGLVCCSSTVGIDNLLLSECVSNPDFIGFKFTDETVRPSPIVYERKDGHKDSSSHISCIAFSETADSVIHATHVLFRRKKQEKGT